MRFKAVDARKIVADRKAQLISIHPHRIDPRWNRIFCKHKGTQTIGMKADEITIPDSPHKAFASITVLQINSGVLSIALISDSVHCNCYTPPEISRGIVDGECGFASSSLIFNS